MIRANRWLLFRTRVCTRQIDWHAVFVWGNAICGIHLRRRSIATSHRHDRLPVLGPLSFVLRPSPPLSPYTLFLLAVLSLFRPPRSSRFFATDCSTHFVFCILDSRYFSRRCSSTRGFAWRQYACSQHESRVTRSSRDHCSISISDKRTSLIRSIPIFLKLCGFLRDLVRSINRFFYFC